MDSNCHSGRERCGVRKTPTGSEKMAVPGQMRVCVWVGLEWPYSWFVVGLSTLRRLLVGKLFLLIVILSGSSPLFTGFADTAA